MGDDAPQSSFRRRLLGFFGLPFLSLAMPLILLPLISRHSGAGGWVAIGIGQSIGAFAAVISAYGWTLVGPTRVATLPSGARRQLYADSLLSRAMVFVVAAPVAVTVAIVISPATNVADAALMTLAAAADCFAVAWYCIGIGRPGLIAQFDLIPRVVGLGLAALVLIAGGPLWAYPALQLASTAIGVLLFSSRVVQLKLSSFAEPRRVLRDMWRDRHSALTLITSGAYSTTPITIVGAVSGEKSAADFISADRMYRVGLFAVQALGNAFQGWVAEDHPRGFSARMRIALLLHLALGLVGFFGLWLLGPPITQWFLGTDVAATPLTMAYFGLAFAAVSINTSLGRHILIPLGHDRAVLLSTVGGSVFGIGAMFFLASAFGGSGGALGLAIGELTVAAIQGTAVLLALRRRGARP